MSHARKCWISEQNASLGGMLGLSEKPFKETREGDVWKIRMPSLHFVYHSGFYPLSGSLPNQEQHSHWQQINPLHRRTFTHLFCKFGTGEDKQIEEAISSCNPCGRGLFYVSIAL